jgi:hypothetical protein
VERVEIKPGKSYYTSFSRTNRDSLLFDYDADNELGEFSFKCVDTEDETSHGIHWCVFITVIWTRSPQLDR